MVSMVFAVVYAFLPKSGTLGYEKNPVKKVQYLIIAFFCQNSISAASTSNFSFFTRPSSPWKKISGSPKNTILLSD